MDFLTLAMAKNYTDKAIEGIEGRITETYSIQVSSWSQLTGKSPFSFKTNITATHTIKQSTICELANNNAVLFANCGLSIGEISGQTITIYAMTRPQDSITLEIDYYG